MVVPLTFCCNNGGGDEHHCHDSGQSSSRSRHDHCLMQTFWSICRKDGWGWIYRVDVWVSRWKSSFVSFVNYICSCSHLESCCSILDWKGGSNGSPLIYHSRRNSSSLRPFNSDSIAAKVLWSLFGDLKIFLEHIFWIDTKISTELSITARLGPFRCKCAEKKPGQNSVGVVPQIAGQCVVRAASRERFSSPTISLCENPAQLSFVPNSHMRYMVPYESICRCRVAVN